MRLKSGQPAVQFTTQTIDGETVSLAQFAGEPLLLMFFLDDLHLSSRGVPKVFTAPVVELGRAILALVEGTLAAPPSGTAWFYGVPQGRTTIGMISDY